MSILSYIRKAIFSKVVITFLMVLFFVPINYYFFSPTHHKQSNILNAVEAQRAVSVISDTSGSSLRTALQSTLSAVSNAATALGVGSLALKENFLDGIFQAAAKVFLRAMVRSIITWINSGFQGSPAFVTDLSGFLLDVADEVVGDFIYNSDDLNFLCSPFQLDVRIALATQYSSGREGNYQPQCTLSDVVDNVDGFLSGSFADGGWPGWLELSISEESNPTLAYLNAEAEMYARIVNAQGEEVELLNFGDGFFSMEFCDVAEQASGSRPNCTIGTPGSVIANSINDALGAGQDELIAADEVNEIFNALFSQLVKQVFQGAYGLLGLGGNSNYSNNTFGSTADKSYLDAIAEEDTKITVDTGYLGENSPIKIALKSEQDFLTVQYEIAGRVAAAKIDYDNASSQLEANGCGIGLTFPSDLESASSSASSEITNGNLLISLLSSLDQGMGSAESVEDQQLVLEQFTQLQSSGVLHTATEITQAELFIEYDLGLAIDNLNKSLDQEIASCNN